MNSVISIIIFNDGITGSPTKTSLASKSGLAESDASDILCELLYVGKGFRIAGDGGEGSMREISLISTPAAVGSEGPADICIECGLGVLLRKILDIVICLTEEVPTHWQSKVKLKGKQGVTGKIKTDDGKCSGRWMRLGAEISIISPKGDYQQSSAPQKNIHRKL